MHQMVSMTDSIFSEHKKYYIEGKFEIYVDRSKKGPYKNNHKIYMGY